MIIDSTCWIHHLSHILECMAWVIELVGDWAMVDEVCTKKCMMDTGQAETTSWSLTFDHLVCFPTTLALPDLNGFELNFVPVSFSCVSSWLSQIDKVQLPVMLFLWLVRCLELWSLLAEPSPAHYYGWLPPELAHQLPPRVELRASNWRNERVRSLKVAQCLSNKSLMAHVLLREIATN